MHIDRQPRARLPGRLAMVFNLLVLIIIVGALAIGEANLQSAGNAIMRVVGVKTSSGSGVSVDSAGKIRYRSRTVTLEDLTEAIRRDVGPDGTVTVQVDSTADAAVVAQVLRAAGRAGAGSVSLSTSQ